jgi:hypothetical protein
MRDLPLFQVLRGTSISCTMTCPLGSGTEKNEEGAANIDIQEEVGNTEYVKTDSRIPMKR